MPSTNRVHRMQADVAIDIAKISPAVGGSIWAIIGTPSSETAALYTTIYAVMMITHHVLTKYLIPAYRHWRACQIRKSRRK